MHKPVLVGKVGLSPEHNERFAYERVLIGVNILEHEGWFERSRDLYEHADICEGLGTDDSIALT